jgi:oxygen-independent coproporphyrinogen-3 oxidase
MGDQARGETSPTIQTYVDTLCREIQATPMNTPPLETVFFGGGTPSLLAPAQVTQLLTTLAARVGIAPNAEISMEMDPGTFGRSQLQALHDLGLNRVSLGVQSFQDEVLAACGRTHRLADIEQAVTDLQAVDIPSWSLDLISGLPHQTLEQWQANVEQAIALGPNHFSIYDLTVEPDTVFERRYEPGQAPLPPEATTADMYRLAQARLTQAGYGHYEISNYAQPGHQCRHNRVYWENRPYYGFGMAATSYTDHQRFGRPRTTHAYAQWVTAYEQGDGTLACTPTPPTEQLLDQLMLGLRLAEGVALPALVQQFGPDILTPLNQALAPFIKQGWVIVETTPIARIRLSDPEGFLFSNPVLAALFQTWETSDS